MDAQATLRYYRSSPRKVRLVADMVRGQAVEPALTSLQLCRKYAAPDVAKLVKSALANLEQAQPGVDVDRVYISTITVDGGDGHVIRGEVPVQTRRGYRRVFFVPAALALLAGTHALLLPIAIAALYISDMVQASRFILPLTWIAHRVQSIFEGGRGS